jgi:SSU ribosomal protein S6P modification protein
MIDKDGKCYIIEVNTSPGTQGIEQATGKSIVEMVVKYAWKKTWNIQPMECGYIEMVDFELLGEIPAKMDTGNGSYCVIDANKWKIEGNIVKWKHNGQEFEHKLDSIKKGAGRWGSKNEYEERPVILLDVRFNGNLYKDSQIYII